MILLWLDVDRGDVETFFAAFLLTSTLQLIPALQQFLAAQNGLGYDDVTAGFGAGTANLLGYYCTLVILVCGSLTIVGRQTKYLLFTTPVGIVWALATALGSILMFVFSALLALVLSPQFRKLKLIVPATALFAVAVFAINEFEVRQHNTTIVDLVSGTLGGLNRYEIDDFGNPGRLALLSSALTLISEDFTTLLLGVGTGSVGTILNEGQLPSHFERLSNLSGARFVPSSLVQFMSEIGVLGLAVTLGIYLLIFFAAVRARKRATDPFDQAMMLALILFVPFLVGASLGETVWTFQAIVYPFWVLAAYAETIIRRQQPATRKGKLARQHPSLSR